MVALTETHQINTQLTLHNSSQSPLTVHALTLSLTKQDDELISCCLTFQLNPQLYHRIHAEALFNLTPEAATPLSPKEFLSEPDIVIETILKPDLLPHLAEHAPVVDKAATYLLELSLNQQDFPLLSTDSWLALSVKQQQESGEIGYRTLWSYISPTALANATTSSDQIAQSIVNFFQDWAEANLSATTQQAASQVLEGINNLVTKLTDVDVDELNQRLEDSINSISKSRELFEEMVNFFKQDNWFFSQVEAEPVLQMAFQGRNGKWTCIARARVEAQQFVFYSLCPVNAPEDKRLAIAELLTRINYDMVIGNFELDFSDGEIRYKTSIDVEGESLSFALIKQLVYANVMMMDTYLPGIFSVIYGNVEPKDAIAQIEE
jgi:hypothetical protein